MNCQESELNLRNIFVKSMKCEPSTEKATTVFVNDKKSLEYSWEVIKRLLVYQS